MIVHVDLTRHPPEVSLREPGDTGRFHVTVVGTTDAALVFGALVDTAAGRLDGDDAWISVDAIRRLAHGRVDDAWDTSFAAMLDDARTKGWLDERAYAIRAHVEWLG